MFSVWMIPVFAYCIWVGKHFYKHNKGHWITFLFFPTAFMIAAIFALLIKSPGYWMPYLMSLCSGCIVGLLIANSMPIKIDLVRQMIFAPGSWLLLFCLITLCISKCAFDWFSVSMPGYMSQMTVISFAIKGAVTGLLYGQAVSFLYRFSIADACSSTELLHGRFAFFCGLKQVSRAEDFRCSSSAV